jgi:hypothetical protein
MLAGHDGAAQVDGSDAVERCFSELGKQRPGQFT